MFHGMSSRVYLLRRFLSGWRALHVVWTFYAQLVIFCWLLLLPESAWLERLRAHSPHSTLLVLFLDQNCLVPIRRVARAESTASTGITPAQLIFDWGSTLGAIFSRQSWRWNFLWFYQQTFLLYPVVLGRSSWLLVEFAPRTHKVLTTLLFLALHIKQRGSFWLIFIRKFNPFVWKCVGTDLDSIRICSHWSNYGLLGLFSTALFVVD